MPLNHETIQAAFAFAKWLANTFYPIEKIQEDERNYKDGYKYLKFVIRAPLLMAATVGGFSLIYLLPESNQEIVAEKIHAETGGDVAIDWRYQLGVAFITMCLSAHLSMYLGKQLHKLITILRYKEQNGNSGAAPFSKDEYAAAIDKHMDSHRTFYDYIYNGDLHQRMRLLEKIYSAKAGDLSFWQGLCQTYGKEHPAIWKHIIEHTQVKNSGALITELEQTDSITSDAANKEARLRDFLITVMEWARLARLNRKIIGIEHLVGCFYPNPREYRSILSKPQWAEVKILLRELRTTGLYRPEILGKTVSFVLEMLEKEHKGIEAHKREIQRLDSRDAPPPPQMHNQTEPPVNAATYETHPEHKITNAALSAHCSTIRFCAQQIQAATMTKDDTEVAKATLTRTANDLKTISTLLPTSSTGHDTSSQEEASQEEASQEEASPHHAKSPHVSTFAEIVNAWKPGSATRQREEKSAHAQEATAQKSQPPELELELMEAGIPTPQSAL
jgi:hypothetical protein